MQYRQLGRSGLVVPVLCLGTATFGGQGDSFKSLGSIDVQEAKRMVSICVDAGLTMFDAADVYSSGLAESILGEAIAGRRDRLLISTKVGCRTGIDQNDVGSSRAHLLRAVEASLRRLSTDYIDLLHIHAFDALTPIEETLRVLDDLVRDGKLRYIGCSNFSGWHLMKSLAISDRLGLSRYVAHQAYYSLIGRDYEWELMPLAIDQGVGTIAWSPLGWGRLTGKIRRGQARPSGGRWLGPVDAAPPVSDETLFAVVEAIEEVGAETGKTVAQIAINWLLQRPSVSTVIIGARNREQLLENLGATDWSLSAAHVARLDAASTTTPPYPYWHQRSFQERNPFPTPG